MTERHRILFSGHESLKMQSIAPDKASCWIDIPDHSIVSVVPFVVASPGAEVYLLVYII